MKYSYDRAAASFGTLLNDVFVYEYRLLSISSQTLYNIHNTRLYIRFNKRSLESSSQRWRSRLITAQRIYNIYRMNRERRMAFHIRFAWDRTMMAIDTIRYNVRRDSKCLKRHRQHSLRNVPVLSARDSRNATEKTRNEKQDLRKYKCHFFKNAN